MRELFSRRYGRLAAGLLVAEFVAATQGLVIASIVPRVVADLHGLSAYPLAFGAFFAAFVIFLPFAGPWADRYGTRRMLATALAVLALGLGLVAAARTMAFFVGARFIEGIGDSLDYAVSFAVVGKAFPDRLRAQMLSLTSAAWIVPAIVAPGIGAYVAIAFGWRWVFAGFLPLVAVAAALLLPAVDFPPEERRRDPFASLRLLVSRASLQMRAGLHASLVAYGLLHAAFFGSDAYVTLVLTATRGMSLQLASFCITLEAAGWSLAALFAPALASRLGRPRLLLAAAAGCLFEAGGLLAVALGAPAVLAFTACAIGGVGIGVAYPTLSAATLGFAQGGDEGAISSATLMAGVLGIVMGVLASGVPVVVASHGGLPLRVALAYSFGIAGFFSVVLAWVSPRLRVSQR